MTQSQQHENFSNLAEFVYNELVNIENNHELSGREKIAALWNLQNDFLSNLVVDEKIAFTDFARFHFIVHKYKLPTVVKNNFVSFKKFRYFLIKNKDFQVQFSHVSHYKQTISDLVAYIVFAKIPLEQKEEVFAEDQENATVLEQVQPRSLRFILSKKEILKDKIILNCLDEASCKVKIFFEIRHSDMIKMLWQTATILVSNIEKINSIFNEIQVEHNHDDEVNIEIITEEIICYKANENTLVVVEPDYLVDVTEITECFTSKSELPITPILTNFLGKKFSVPAFKGNIVNNFFDELLENAECDFDTAIVNALSKKPLAMLVYEKEMTEKSLKTSDKETENKQTLEDKIRFFRAELYEYFVNLRNIILDNYINTTNYMEPSFISTSYGLQGRLDLIAIDKDRMVNIVELKSGKAPQNNIRASFGLDEVRTLILPLWINHYVQIICYNILLQEIFKENISNSSILYAKPNEIEPLRSVVDNEFVKREIVIIRNWIMAYQRELAIGNIDILTALPKSQIDSFPIYLQDDIKQKIEILENLSEVERDYLRVQLAFVTKEIFASKIGLYSDNRKQGFSSLWLDSIDEKKQRNNIIAHLQLNLEKSDFGQMHIVFNRSDKQNLTTFRKGDICIIYPENNKSDLSEETNGYALIEHQLLRGRISYIDEKEIVVSLRNKFTQNVFQTVDAWCLEADYIDMLNTNIYSSIGEFITSDFDNKKKILGIEEAKFLPLPKEIENYIDEIEIENDKKNILKKALSAENYFLIQGPPGTGKTSYILRYLTQTLFEKTNENVLILAYTNRAADEICSALNRISEDFPFLRLGNRDSSQHTEKLISFIPLEDISKKINETRIFISTVTSANHTPELFDLKEIDTVIIDEATQILEMNIVGILAKVKRFIMIGDEKQLPAVTTVAPKELEVNNELLNEICLENLQCSLFERLLKVSKKNNWDNYAMLTEQRRMSPEVMKLCNKLFYGEKLCTPDQKTKQKEVKNLFINTNIEKTSKINTAEVEIIAKLIQKIEQDFEKRNEKLNEDSIGIISPWRVQCSEIYNALTDSQRDIITVDTVERFQGSERDIIIFSTATNNLFLLDLLSESKIIDGLEVDRKLNVAISRAKKQFILLGNKELLSQKIVYKNLIQLLEEVDYTDI